jgi:adenine-specific DNA-methyltransferase
MNFNELSVTLTKQISKETKKDEGIYFTPKPLIQKIVDFVLEKHDVESALEPSCGSGQFLEYLLSKNVNVTAIEKNETIYNAIKNEYNVIHGDFLEHTFEQFDLIIGNPPYFVVPKKSVDKRYQRYFDGRPNIYILFIIKAFELLHENGILAFVLPSNFLNCVYYNKLRKYLSGYTILDVYTSSEKFLETAQEICVFIVQKKQTKNQPFVIHFGEIVVFKPVNEIQKIKKLVLNSTTLSKLGCKLNIGTVVWNECKKDLTDDPTKTLLIYSSDFKNNVLDIQRYREPSKKNYINKQGSTDTVLLVNRGYGTKYIFNYCLVELNTPFLIENHCIVIQANPEILRKIVNSFENTKTKEFIDLVFSNNAINMEELAVIFPIYI